jgi:hypothetical protein
MIKLRNLSSIMGALECTKLLRHSYKITAIGSQIKGSYYVVNRVLYSYMYDYNTSVYEKAALTQK